MPIKKGRFIGVVIAVLVVVSWKFCSSVTLPPALTPAQEALIRETHFHMTVGVESFTSPVYSERLTVNLRNTGLFDAVRPLDSIPRPDLIARVTRPIYGNAVIPIFTAISLGLVPTISDEEWGDAFVLIRTADTTKQVPVEFSYHGPTTLGWFAVIQNLRRDRTADDPYTTARFRDGLRWQIAQKKKDLLSD